MFICHTQWSSGPPLLTLALFAVRADGFAFLQEAASSKEKWDVVIVDPPSFAPNQASVEKAKASYIKLFTHAAQVSR